MKKLWIKKYKWNAELPKNILNQWNDYQIGLMRLENYVFRHGFLCQMTFKSKFMISPMFQIEHMSRPYIRLGKKFFRILPVDDFRTA